MLIHIDTHIWTTEAYLYYKLTNEPLSELKTILKYMMVIFFHVTLKHHQDDQGQQFRLYTFDPVRFSLITAAVQGCS